MRWLIRFLLQLLQKKHPYTHLKYSGNLNIHSTKKVVVSCEKIREEFFKYNHENLNDYFPQNIFFEIINSGTKQKVSFLGEDEGVFYSVINAVNEESISIYFNTPYSFNEFFQPTDLLSKTNYLALGSEKSYFEICQSLELADEMISIKCKTQDLLEFHFFKVFAFCIANTTDGLINTTRMPVIEMENYDAKNWEESFIKKMIS